MEEQKNGKKISEIAYKLMHYFKQENGKITITDEGLSDQTFMDMWHGLSDIQMDREHKMLFAQDFLSDLSDNDIGFIDNDLMFEFADNDTDIYTSDLTAFLCASDSNVYYLTQAIKEYQPNDGFEALQIAEMLGREEVYQAIADYLNGLIEAEEEDAE